MAMGKSARVLGWEFGKTAQEMNLLLKDYGYLEGEPGAYGLTDKGKQFGDEQYNENGYGGYAHRGWETRTWNDDLAGALRADMEAYPDGPPEPTNETEQESSAEDEDEYVVVYDDGPDDAPELDGKTMLILGGVAVSALLVWRYGPPLWKNHIKPAAVKVRDRFTKSKPDSERGEEATSQEPA